MHLTETTHNQFEEWKQCVDLLDKFEDRLDAVRKYGFTFIAGLLSADALLGQVSGTVIAPSTKLVVVWIAAFLLLILRVLDRNYQLFQSAIGSRARSLERELGMGLELSIIEKYVALKMWRFTNALYYGFEFLVLLLGVAIVWGDELLVVLAVLGPVIAMVSIFAIEPAVKRSKKQSEKK